MKYKGWVMGDCEVCGKKSIKGRYFNSIALERYVFKCMNCLEELRLKFENMGSKKPQKKIDDYKK